MDRPLEPLFVPVVAALARRQSIRSTGNEKFILNPTSDWVSSLAPAPSPLRRSTLDDQLDPPDCIAGMAHLHQRRHRRNMAVAGCFNRGVVPKRRWIPAPCLQQRCSRNAAQCVHLCVEADDACGRCTGAAASPAPNAALVDGPPPAPPLPALALP